MKYIVKNESGTFDAADQPDGFVAIAAIENRLFICESPTEPVGDFVVLFPEEQQQQMIYYAYPNGKKLPFDPFNGAVEFGLEVDNKNRREIIYTEEQMNTKLTIMKWLMINVWIPDKARMYSVPEEIVASYIVAVNNLTDAVTARTYIDKNLYYNL